MLGAQRSWRGTQDVLLALVAAVGVGAAPFFASAVEPWAQVLSDQLELEQKCSMSATYDVQQWTLGDETVLSGKARCHDGREFDFSQKKNHLKFDFKACDPAVC
jgi:hypothetical protein